MFAKLLFSCTIALFCGLVSAQQDESSIGKNRTSELYDFGGLDVVTPLSSVSHYNSTTGKWDRTADMSVPRAYACGAVVGTKIYIFGGESNDKDNIANHLLTSAEVFDSETETFSPLPPLPVPRSACAAAALGDDIYITGGVNGNHHNSTIRFNTKTMIQEEVAPMSTARVVHQLVELGGRLYAIGGYHTETSVEAYNATTDQWAAVASTHHEFSWFGATAASGKIYVCNHKGFEVYDPEADRWQTLSSVILDMGISLVSMDGQLWALGGGPPSGSMARSYVHSYDLKTGTWHERPEMNIPRNRHIALVVNR